MTISPVEIVDARIRQALQEKSGANHEYWSFRGRAKRDAAHSLIQYPAMMVPQMQREIIDIMLAAMPRSAKLFDPFVGSGTVLTEAMRCGKEFVGFDINPLAVLACKVKAGPFYLAALEEKIDSLCRHIRADYSNSIGVSFPGWEKWFNQDIAKVLSKIKRAIEKEPALWARRFFWLALAELTRVASNSRTSTFKLHVRAEDDLCPEPEEILPMFEATLESNFDAYKEQAKLLGSSLSKGGYKPEVTIKTQDTAIKSRLSGLMGSIDLMVSSPPYGDNRTTVPYGQFSYLALQWINLHDIDRELTSEVLKSTQEIDARSLGGSVKLAESRAQALRQISPSFWTLYELLFKSAKTKTHAKRLAAFTADLAQAINVVGGYVRTGGYAVWTLGDRNTGGCVVPLADIVSECFTQANFVEVARIERSIPHKRMPKKNNVSDTMNDETTLILRKK